jgi:hypothetical protein
MSQPMAQLCTHDPVPTSSLGRSPADRRNRPSERSASDGSRSKGFGDGGAHLRSCSMYHNIITYLSLSSVRQLDTDASRASGRPPSSGNWAWPSHSRAGFAAIAGAIDGRDSGHRDISEEER